MNRLVLATRNKGKIAEIGNRLKFHNISVSSLLDVDFDLDIEETADSFEENALIKAEAVSLATRLPALADDSGLIVDALGGRPGIHSARYGGAGVSDEQRCKKLLGELAEVRSSQRTARFKAAIALVLPTGESHVFQGVLEGTIAFSPAGKHGFGYDPIFIPAGYERTLAELGPEIKDQISHRAKALSGFLEWVERGREGGF